MDPSDSNTRHKNPPEIDRSKLSELYPTPKTYDEKRQERADLNALHESRKPKYPKLQALGILLIIGALFYSWIALVPGLFSVPFPGVFTAALLGLALVYIAYAGAKKILQLLTQ